MDSAVAAAVSVLGPAQAGDERGEGPTEAERGEGPTEASDVGSMAGSIPVDIDEEAALGADYDEAEQAANTVKDKKPPDGEPKNLNIDFWIRCEAEKGVPTTWVRHHAVPPRGLFLPLLPDGLPYLDGPDHYLLMPQRLTTVRP